LLETCVFVRKTDIYCNPFKLVRPLLKSENKMSSQPKEEGEVLENSETEEELIEEEKEAPAK
jgi:hypothetical protein